MWILQHDYGKHIGRNLDAAPFQLTISKSNLIRNKWFLHVNPSYVFQLQINDLTSNNERYVLNSAICQGEAMFGNPSGGCSFGRCF